MTIKEAIEKRIPRVRLSIWASANCYLRLPLFADGSSGPWAELYDDRVQRDVLKIRPGSQRECVLLEPLRSETDFEIYAGDVSDYEQHPDNFAKGYAES